jgi:hypothetical protein
MKQNMKLFYKYNARYDSLVDESNSSIDDKEIMMLERQQEKSYNKASEYFGELTKTEQRTIPIDIRRFY